MSDTYRPEGDPDGIRSVGNHLSEMADKARHSGNRLRELRDGDLRRIWTGDASEAFADGIEMLPEDLRKLERSLEEASSAVFSWASSLDRLQDDAERQSRDSQRASGVRTDAIAARDREIAQLVEEALYDPLLGLVRPSAVERLQYYQDRVDDAETDLRRVRNRIDRTREDVEAAAQRAAAMLEEASRLGIQNKTWLEELGDFFKELGEKLRLIITFLDELLDLIGPFLSIALTILSFVPGYGVIAAGLLLALAAADLGLTATRAGLGLALHGETDVTVGDLLEDSLDVGLAVVGFGAAKSAVAAAKGAQLSRLAKVGKGIDAIATPIGLFQDGYEIGSGFADGSWVESASELFFDLPSLGEPLVGVGDVIDIFDGAGGDPWSGSDDIPPLELPEEPPVVEPPVVEPPVVEPPGVEPPVIEPPVTEPPVVEPPGVEPPSGGGGFEPPVVEPPGGESGGEWTPAPDLGSGGGGGGGGFESPAAGGGDWVAAPESGSAGSGSAGGDWVPAADHNIGDHTEMPFVDFESDMASSSDISTVDAPQLVESTPDVSDVVPDSADIGGALIGTADGGSGINTGAVAAGGAMVAGAAAAALGAKRVSDGRKAAEDDDEPEAAASPWGKITADFPITPAAGVEESAAGDPAPDEPAALPEVPDLPDLPDLIGPVGETAAASIKESPARPVAEIAIDTVHPEIDELASEVSEFVPTRTAKEEAGDE